MNNGSLSRYPSFECANSAQIDLYRALLESASPTSPRGMPTQEILFCHFEIKNPRKRFTSLKNRGFSGKLAVGELCWHLRASQSASELAYYAPRWMDFADPDGKIRGSCYGYKIFKKQNSGQSQWDSTATLLSKDAHTRRAVLSFHGQDFSKRIDKTDDVACVSSLQFFVRNERLHAVTTMRSNDVFWGLPYDIFVMTSLQELMATTLGLKLGTYHHQCGSMHVYDDKVSRLKKIVMTPQVEAFEMNRMNDITGIRDLLAFEEHVRSGGVSETDHGKSDFWTECKSLLIS